MLTLIFYRLLDLIGWAIILGIPLGFWVVTP